MCRINYLNSGNRTRWRAALVAHLHAGSRKYRELYCLTHFVKLTEYYHYQLILIYKILSDESNASPEARPGVLF